MSAPNGYEWPVIAVHSQDLGRRLAAVEGELSRLRHAVVDLCVEAEGRRGCPTGGLVSARRLRQALAGKCDLGRDLLLSVTTCD